LVVTTLYSYIIRLFEYYRDWIFESCCSNESQPCLCATKRVTVSH